MFRQSFDDNLCLPQPRPALVGLLVTQLIAIGIGATGCRDMLTSKPSGPISKSVDSTMVVPALSGRLDARGHFKLATPQVGPEEIDSTQAVLLAAAWARQFAPLILTMLAQQHGGPMNAASLSPCGLAYYAESPYEPIDSSVTNLVWRRPFGAQWLVTLCGVDGPEVSLAVAALNTDLTLKNGRIVFPYMQGNSFFALGIPSSDGGLTLTPEGAAQFVFARFGVRVATLPELVLGSQPDAPQFARWHFRVASDLALKKSNGSRVRTSDIWIRLERGNGPVLFVPRDAQPISISPKLRQWSPEHGPARPPFVRPTIQRHAGIPLLFDPVTPIGN